MESSSTTTMTPTKFRFRDHNRTEMEEDAHSETSSGMSSVSSELDADAESELQSMTGKGIKHLCSELLELKAESDEDFRRNISSNYSSFVRIFDEVKNMENELMQLKSEVLTQKKLVKDIIDGIHLKVLSEETINSILQEPEYAEPTPASEFSVHMENILETLDVLILENRVDEAIAILHLEDENLQRMQIYEENSPRDLFILYNSMISEKKAMLTLQLTLSAENPRICAAELQKVLVGIYRLGNSPLATELLFKYYHSRLVSGIQNLQCSQSFLDGLYIKELAKFVFSMISQAARSYLMLFGENSPHALELIQWAREETGLFVSSFDKYVKSSSDIMGGLSAAVEAIQFAILYCSLLKSQRLFLQPYLIKHIRPSMEEVLQIHIDHFKKVISMFTATEAWDLGRYRISEILSGNTYMVGDKQPEFCVLTNSGQKFLTLLQEILSDVTPLLVIQMERSILKGLMDLFTEYVAILEKDITFETQVSEKDLRRNSAESLPQQISVIANLSTLQNLFIKLLKNYFRGIDHRNSGLKNKKSIDFQQKEVDVCIIFIQEALAQLRAHFYQQIINRMTSFRTSYKLMEESCSENQKEPSMLNDAMPSVAFQVLFLELRKVHKLAEDNIFEEDWLMELLRDLIAAIFSWTETNKEIWRNTKENASLQLSDIIRQLVFDMVFLEEIVKYGGYFSKKPLVLQSLLDSAFNSTGLDPKRDIDGDGWARNAATEAIHKLLEFEKMQLLKDDLVDSSSEEPPEKQFDYENDPDQDESRSIINEDSLMSDEDPPFMDATEVAIPTESPPERSLSPSEVEDILVNNNVIVWADNPGGPEDVNSEIGTSKAYNKLHLREKFDFSCPSSSSDETYDPSKQRVPLKEDAGTEAYAIDSKSNKLDENEKIQVKD